MVKRKIHEVDTFLRSYPNIKDKINRGCYYEGCRKAYGEGRKGLGYGPKGGDRESCKTHKRITDVEQNILCIYKGCKTKGTIFLGDHKVCSTHIEVLKEDGQFPEEYVTRSKNTNVCIVSGCGIIASYDKNKHCKTHAESSTSDDKRRCDYPGCKSKSRPTFGFHGEKKTRCKDHKEANMFSRKLCSHYPDCTLSASYGTPDGIALTCVQHKLEHYILNVLTCEVRNCRRQVCFGYINGESTHCSEHKEPGQIDLRNKRCMHDGCDKNRSFGEINGERKWCSQHKEEGDVNLVEILCAMPCCIGIENQVKDFYPEHMAKNSEYFGKRICLFAKRVFIEDAIMSGDINKVYEYKKFFNIKEIVTLNAQSAFRIECEKHYFPILEDCVSITFDTHVREGDKVNTYKRPDIFYKWNVGDMNFAIHLEYDENSSHEDNEDRVKIIHKDAECEGTTYLIRIQGGHDTKNPLCKDVLMEDYKYAQVTEEGINTAKKVADVVKERINWIKDGLGPYGEMRPFRVNV